MRRYGVTHRDAGSFQPLPLDECWKKLNEKTFGRIAVTVSNRPDIFPINYVVHEGKLYFRTTPGSKLTMLTVERHVAFQIDHFEQNDAWSVTVKGVAAAMTSFDDVIDSNALSVKPWLQNLDDVVLRSWDPTVKQVFVEITPAEVTGRVLT